VELKWYNFVWAIINFLVIFAILYKFFYHPVLKFLDDRGDGIALNISEAERARADADAVLKGYSDKMASAKQESMEIMERATQVGEETRRALLEQSRTESAALIDKARQEIQRERDEAINSLRREVGSIAVMAAEKILGRAVTEADHAHVVDEFLNEVGEVN
jgi:F-type H+-transporting ATPase subunit b